jgi:hypothetical protein
MSRRKLSLLGLVAALSLSCARPPETRHAPRPIDILRERAADAPNSREAWLDLAVAEHVFDGGEPQRAREALARAKLLGASSLRLAFIEAEEHVLEGHPAQAFEAYLRLLHDAPNSDDALTPWLLETTFSALSDMNDAVDDYRPRLLAELATLSQQRDKLGLTAQHQLSMQLLGHALLAGDMERAQAAAKAAGCVQKAEVAGPFGPRELLGFDREFPAEKPGPLAAEYELGPSRGTRPTRSV